MTNPKPSANQRTISFVLYTYDLWGGDEPGTWYVNDTFRHSEHTIPKATFDSDPKLKRYLKRTLNLKRNLHLSSLVLGGDDTYVTLTYETQSTYQPLCELRVIQKPEASK